MIMKANSAKHILLTKNSKPTVMLESETKDVPVIKQGSCSCWVIPSSYYEVTIWVSWSLSLWWTLLFLSYYRQENILQQSEDTPHRGVELGQGSRQR